MPSKGKNFEGLSAKKEETNQTIFAFVTFLPGDPNKSRHWTKNEVPQSHATLVEGKVM